MSSLLPSPATILIIDDDPLARTATAAVLHMQGHQCHCAADRAAALKAAATLPLDLIVCDLERKRDDGLQLCADIRSLPALGDVPAVLLAGSDTGYDPARVRQAGAVYWLRKPFDPHVLIDLVDRALWLPHLVDTQVRHGAASQPPKANMLRPRRARR